VIYFLQPVDGGPVKIGFTDNLDVRRKALEANYGRELAILAMLDGGREEEAEVHARFSHLRFGRTEQFKPAPDLMAFIGRPLLVDANPDAVEVMASLSPGNVLALKGTDSWKVWLDGFAKRKGMPVTVLVDHALRELAKQDGYGDPPSRV
jgi:hypothetical protein